MAITSLFIDLDVLKARVGLSNATQADQLAKLNQALQEVRIGFYKSLGAARISQLLAVASSDAPATSSQIDRTLTETTEVNWVKMLLLRSMPSFYMTAAVGQAWNEENLTQSTDQFAASKEINRLNTEIQSALSSLMGEDEDDGQAVASCIGPLTTQPRPGESIRSSS